ncbi:hypothetical protein HYV80_03745 [Candidatus Woesearchaeota archaeon]|nr:hypothetical protein [Candidatus Woesearchaeota archaeon]
MNYSNGLEYLIRSSYSNNSYPQISYLSRNVDDKYEFGAGGSVSFEPQYTKKPSIIQHARQQYASQYTANHSFTPELFLNPSRPKSGLMHDNDEVTSIAEEIFKLMFKEKLPGNISISILPLDEFKTLHSNFGAWSSGIMGFSINGKEKKIFARETHLDSLMLIIGHEIGHVLTEALPNKHDEEAKAFAFSIEWAKTIKKHNVAGLGPNIKDETELQPARNGLHDAAFEFVDFMVKKGRKAIELHNDLAKRYVSVFNRVYF